MVCDDNFVHNEHVQAAEKFSIRVERDHEELRESRTQGNRNGRSKRSLEKCFTNLSGNPARNMDRN